MNFSKEQNKIMSLLDEQPKVSGERLRKKVEFELGMTYGRVAFSQDAGWLRAHEFIKRRKVGNGYEFSLTQQGQKFLELQNSEASTKGK